MLSTRIAEWVRGIGSLAPVIGLVARPEPRPNGISAVVRVKGEEEWIEPCLLSIRDFADEILVLNNEASAETQKALDRVRDVLRELLRLEHCPALDLFQLSNLGLDKARFRWVIRWDADFVAHTSGKGDILNLRRYLLALDPRRYYLVYVPAAEVAGDLFHQFPDLRFRVDGQVHTASRWTRYVPVRRVLNMSALASPDRVLRAGSVLQITHESLKVPRWYQVLRWEDIAYFHVNVKSGRHMLLRHFWFEWLNSAVREPAVPMEEYVRQRVRHGWGASGLAEAERLYVAEYCRRLVPFDGARCGPYPELLLPHLRQPRYRIEYQDGVIVGRKESSRNG